jgi:hypothetical protein
LLALGAAPLHAELRDPWAKGTEWISFRAGYAKSSAAGAADGNVGAGFGYARFRNSQWSYGAQAAIDVLGRYGGATEIESPWTFELLRHYRWRTPARPYLGFGAGAYFHTITGTSDNRATVMPGYYLTGGLTSRISDHGLFGFDVRASMVELDQQKNPVFGGEATLGERQKRAAHWSAKITYAWAF